jgi:two-component system sensor histidine kinase HydH
MQSRWLDIKVKKFLILVICAFIFISGVDGYLGYVAKLEIEKIVTNQFNQQQLIIARKIAQDIRDHFDFLETQLLFVNQCWQQGTRSTDDIRTDISSVFPLLTRWHVVAVAHVSEQEHASIAFSGSGFVDVGKLGIDYEMYRLWSMDRQHRGKSIVGHPTRPESGPFKGRFLMVVGAPVWKMGTPPQSASNSTFEGFSFVLVDPIAIAKMYTGGLYSGETGYAWVIDNEGTFLAHYEQSFVGEDFFTVRERRNPHISYERINRTVREHVLKGEEGTGWYISGWHRGVIGEMKKIFAYTPVFFSKDSPENLWSVAVTAPVAEVYGIIDTAVKRQWLIAGIFELVVFLCLVLAIHFSLRWSRTLQTEVANKTTDLTRSEAEVRQERDKVKESMERLVEIQDKLIRSERFAAIGEAAAYLSHEIKNPLVVIGGFAAQVERSLDENDARRKKLQLIQDEARRLELMLTEVRDFTRPAKPQKELQPINSVIENTVALMEDMLREKGVLCEKSLGHDRYPVLLDPQQIEQLLINLLKNALEAMPDGGRITILSTVERGYARVSIVDSGAGMSPEMVSKIFNPFYTTKKKGTGLGLAVCRKIIEDHGGEISVRSEEGEGTEVTFILPVGTEET